MTKSTAAKAEERQRFKLGDREFELLTLDDMEFREIELLEDAFDKSIEEIDLRRAKAVRLVVYMSVKRADPDNDLTLDELAEMELSQLQEIEPPKKAPAGRRPTKSGE